MYLGMRKRHAGELAGRVLFGESLVVGGSVGSWWITVGKLVGRG